DQRFGFAAREARLVAVVDVGGIDRVEACIHKGIENREGRLPVGVPAEDIASQHQRRDPQFRPSELPHFHDNRSPLAPARLTASPPCNTLTIAAKRAERQWNDFPSWERTSWMPTSATFGTS